MFTSWIVRKTLPNQNLIILSGHLETSWDYSNGQTERYYMKGEAGIPLHVDAQGILKGISIRQDPIMYVLKVSLHKPNKDKTTKDIGLLVKKSEFGQLTRQRIPNN